ncbi:hypothetical protein [Synechococcus sp. PROS-7-1]|uniref:hypothetical protein n=1 Tax=Synechococcus sp. PROS-7-1 TaxID=1442556 RepID=UPI00164499D5|nr:hypothetical protein [Synechococcus sp. PROS-7-1]
MAGRSFFIQMWHQSTSLFGNFEQQLQMVDLLFQGRFASFQFELSLMSLLVHLRATTIHHL